MQAAHESGQRARERGGGGRRVKSCWGLDEEGSNCSGLLLRGQLSSVALWIGGAWVGSRLRATPLNLSCVEAVGATVHGVQPAHRSGCEGEACVLMKTCQGLDEQGSNSIMGMLQAQSLCVAPFLGGGLGSHSTATPYATTHACFCHRPCTRCATCKQERVRGGGVCAVKVTRGWMKRAAAQVWVCCTGSCCVLFPIWGVGWAAVVTPLTLSRVQAVCHLYGIVRRWKLPCPRERV